MKTSKFILGLVVLLFPFSVMSQNATTHIIGEHFGGGIVFYVTPDGQHGLIAETRDQVRESPVLLPEVLGNPALLSDEGKNFTDWRYPEYAELQILYKNKDFVGQFDEKGFYVDAYIFTYPGATSRRGIAISFKNDAPMGQLGRPEMNVRLIRSF
ncbi:MAG: hypothetical protein ACLQMF_04615 [Rectinemataceae bacterium]